jgi:hypothetical protein
MGSRMSARVFSMVIALSILALAAGGCASTTGQQPIEIVSVTGPMSPINPGGPIVEITMKNISDEPIVTLTARLETAWAFTCTCDVTADNPLLPGKSVTARINMIGGGFSSTVSYPMTVIWTRPNGDSFSFTQQVKILAPAK